MFFTYDHHLGFQGMCSFKQRITFKKAGDGFLFYALCDSMGYLYQFFPFFDPQIPIHFGLSKTFSAVVELCKRVPTTSSWHHVYMDNLYGNVKLAEALLSLKFECTSTMRSDRIPKALSLPKNAQKNDFVAMYKNGVCVIKWIDKKEVKLLTTSNYHFPLKLVSTPRRRAALNLGTLQYEKVQQEVEVLNVAKDYNYHMNGVDIQDQYRHNFNLKLRKRKWWLPVWFFLLESCMCNSYLCYNNT